MPAHAHDWKRPDLDGWYSSLHRKGPTFGCCRKEDRHTTEAEVRNGVWWARIGRPVIAPDGVNRDGVLLGVRIPDELIVRGENGLPAPNPEGEAVLCHSIVWRSGRTRFHPHDALLLCAGRRGLSCGVQSIMCRRPSPRAGAKALSPGNFPTLTSKSRAGQRASWQRGTVIWQRGCARMVAWPRQRISN
jgi:hypothetical protein